MSTEEKREELAKKILFLIGSQDKKE